MNSNQIFFFSITKKEAQTTFIYNQKKKFTILLFFIFVENYCYYNMWIFINEKFLRELERLMPSLVTVLFTVKYLAPLPFDSFLSVRPTLTASTRRTFMVRVIVIFSVNERNYTSTYIYIFILTNASNFNNFFHNLKYKKSNFLI